MYTSKWLVTSSCYLRSSYVIILYYCGVNEIFAREKRLAKSNERWNISRLRLTTPLAIIYRLLIKRRVSCKKLSSIYYANENVLHKHKWSPLAKKRISLENYRKLLRPFLSAARKMILWWCFSPPFCWNYQKRAEKKKKKEKRKQRGSLFGNLRWLKVVYTVHVYLIFNPREVYPRSQREDGGNRTSGQAAWSTQCERCNPR